MRFRISSLAKSILFGNFNLGMVCYLAILVKEGSNFGNSCTEIQNFVDSDLEKVKFGNICLENAN